MGKVQKKRKKTLTIQHFGYTYIHKTNTCQFFFTFFSCTFPLMSPDIHMVPSHPGRPAQQNVPPWCLTQRPSRGKRMIRRLVQGLNQYCLKYYSFLFCRHLSSFILSSCNKHQVVMELRCGGKVFHAERMLSKKHSFHKVRLK